MILDVIEAFIERFDTLVNRLDNACHGRTKYNCTELTYPGVINLLRGLDASTQVYTKYLLAHSESFGKPQDIISFLHKLINPDDFLSGDYRIEAKHRTFSGKGEVHLIDVLSWLTYEPEKGERAHETMLIDYFIEKSSTRS